MPIVPSSGGPSVLMGQTPTPRGSLEDFGGGQAAAPLDLAPVANEATRIYQVEKQKADQIAVVDAGSKLSALETNLLFDPDKGVLSQKGKNAIGAQDQAMQSWQDQTSAIENGLTNNDQKAQFRRMVAAHGASLNEQIQRHVANERQTYEKETVASYLANEQNAALAAGLTDPNRVEQAIGNQTAAIKDFGARNGWSDDQIKNHIDDTVSATRYGVLERMVNAEQDIAATQYLAQHRDDFVGKDLEQAERLTDAGSVRASSQREADAITSTATDLGGALKAVHDITDPRVRDAAEQRVRRFYEDQAADQRQQRAAAFDRVGRAVEQNGGDVHKVPMSDWLQLSVEERTAIQHRADDIAHPKTKTDWDTYQSLMNMAGLSDVTKQHFEGLDLTQYRGQLADTEFRSLVSLQRSLRTKDASAVAGEAKRESDVATKAAAAAKKKADERAANIETLKAMGVNVGPAVPGAPLPARQPANATPNPAPAAPGATTSPSAPAATSGQKVPQAWIDRAHRDPNYKLYLQHMGITVP